MGERFVNSVAGGAKLATLYLQMQSFVSKRVFNNHPVQVENEDGEEKIATLHQLGDKQVTRVSDANFAELKAVPEVR
jgi:hypothetical protein